MYLIVRKKIVFLPLFVFVALFPFFEGGESSNGLLIFHTITLAFFAAVAFLSSQLLIPGFLLYWVPFLLILLLNVLIAPYKFAAFLKMWEYLLAGLWAIPVCTIVRLNKDTWEKNAGTIFITGAAGIVAAILIYNTTELIRIGASFVNPNDYASYALMFLVFGAHCILNETAGMKKTILVTLTSILLLSISLSFSRGVLLATAFLVVSLLFGRKPGRAISVLFSILLMTTLLVIVLRFSVYQDPLRYYRWKIWSNTLAGVSGEPYMGIGLGMLPYKARVLNFPGDSDVGRYGRIARSADSQYIEILTETGFLGLAAFLLGWMSIYFSQRKLSDRYFYLRQVWLILSVVSLFSLPLQNTSVLYLFILLTVIPIALDMHGRIITVSLGRLGRIFIPVLCFLLFTFGVYFPYRAHQEYNKAAMYQVDESCKMLINFHSPGKLYDAVIAGDPRLRDLHLGKAMKLNPYQPYYYFQFLKRIIDLRPSLSPEIWSGLINYINDAIRLNPLESDFYAYRAKVNRILFEHYLNRHFYSGAISSYQTALDYNPYNVFLRMEFASFLLRVEKLPMAEVEIRKTLEIEPAFLNARLMYAEVLAEKKDMKEAIRQYERFRQDDLRFRNQAAYPPSPYVAALLKVNLKQKTRVQNVLGATQK